MALVGQSALTARHVLEAGAELVSVFWDEYQIVNTAWDTHFNHSQWLGDALLPGFDAAVSSLSSDLDERRMLDDILVLCLTERGCTPMVNGKKHGDRREHWSEAKRMVVNHHRRA